MHFWPIVYETESPFESRYRYGAPELVEMVEQSMEGMTGLESTHFDREKLEQMTMDELDTELAQRALPMDGTRAEKIDLLIEATK